MPSGSLKDWLRPADSALADLYVVGLQEIDDDPGAYIRHNPFRQGLWTEIVQKSLEAGGQPVVKVGVVLVWNGERSLKLGRGDRSRCNSWLGS